MHTCRLSNNWLIIADYKWVKGILNIYIYIYIFYFVGIEVNIVILITYIDDNKVIQAC